jgi:hypothetical protein
MVADAKELIVVKLWIQIWQGIIRTGRGKQADP